MKYHKPVNLRHTWKHSLENTLPEYLLNCGSNPLPKGEINYSVPTAPHHPQDKS